MEFAAVEPHAEITPLFEDVWSVTGSVVMAPLVRITRTMVILRASDGLTVVNAVRLSDAGERRLAELGEVRHVVRIGGHKMDDAWYVHQHGASLWALPGVRHLHCLETAEVLQADHVPMSELELFQFEHTVDPEAALLYRRHGGLLITCDSVQNWEHTDGCSAMGKLAAHAMGFMTPAQIGPPWRKRMTPAGGTLEPDFHRLLDLEFRHLIGAHGGLLRDEAQSHLRATIERTYR